MKYHKILLLLYDLKQVKMRLPNFGMPKVNFVYYFDLKQCNL